VGAVLSQLDKGHADHPASAERGEIFHGREGVSRCQARYIGLRKTVHITNRPLGTTVAGYRTVVTVVKLIQQITRPFVPQ